MQMQMHMQRSEGGLPEALTRLTTVEVWLVRAMIPAMAVTLIAGGTIGAATLIEFARSDGSGGGASPQDSQPEEPDEGLGSSADGAPAAGDVVLADLAVDHGPPDYAAILSRRYPGAQWSLDGDRYEGLVWLDASPKPTQVELDALWPEVAEELARERAARDAEERLAARAREQELQYRRDDPALQATLDGLDPRRIWGGTPDYAAILSRRFPGAQWSLDGNDPSRLRWSGPGSAPTKAQLDAMWADVAREMALELDPEELARWAGTGEQVYVDGVLRPKGWVGGANDPQPRPVATPRDVQYLPQIPHTNNGSPVGTIGILKDPTGAQNFEQKYGLQLHELGALIAEAHGYFGGSHGLGLSLNGDRELMWYSDQVDPAIVAQVLAGLGAVEPSPPPAAPAQPDPQPDAQPDPSEDDAAQD
jgi:hypothetical protein